MRSVLGSYANCNRLHVTARRSQYGHCSSVVHLLPLLFEELRLLLFLLHLTLPLHQEVAVARRHDERRAAEFLPRGARATCGGEWRSRRQTKGGGEPEDK